MATHAASYRVLYRDIDSMGVLYYGRYLAMFEMGRVEWMRAEGCRYRDLEQEHGILLPVTEARCRYRAPIQYDDLLLVRTQVARWSASRIAFSHRIVVPEGDSGEILARSPASGASGSLSSLPDGLWDGSMSRICAEGEVELGCVRAGDMRPTRLPKPFFSLLEQVVPTAKQSGRAAQD